MTILPTERQEPVKPELSYKSYGGAEQIWYELYNCFAVFEPRSPGLVFLTHFLDLLKHNDVAAREEVV